MIRKNSALKVAIFESGTTQTKLAEEIGLIKALLSLAIQGKYILDADPKRAIAGKLNKKVSEIFTE